MSALVRYSQACYFNTNTAALGHGRGQTGIVLTAPSGFDGLEMLQ